MTGLEPHRHVIIEIATVLTDDDLNIVAEGPDLVIHAGEEPLSEMGEFVTEMHTKSGLIDEVRTSSISMAEAENQTLDFFGATTSNPERSPCAAIPSAPTDVFCKNICPLWNPFFTTETWTFHPERTRSALES